MKAQVTQCSRPAPYSKRIVQCDLKIRRRELRAVSYGERDRGWRRDDLAKYGPYPVCRVPRAATLHALGAFTQLLNGAVDQAQGSHSLFSAYSRVQV